MSYSKVKSFRPCYPSTSDHESPSATKSTTIPNSSTDGSTRSPVPNTNNKHKANDALKRKKSDGSASDSSVHSLAGGKLTEAPGRLTPTCPGRIKAPPFCSNGALKRVASTIQDIECYSLPEAEICAQKCLVVAGRNSDMNVEDIPFNIDGGEFDPVMQDNVPEGVASVECKPHISSSSTVVTNTSASSCVLAASCTQTVLLQSAKEGPPLEVVRTDELVLTSEDESGGPKSTKSDGSAKLMPAPSSPKSLPPSFTDKLIKEHQSRQGRSLQRWLVHSQTESLVRQVAGCVPITRDGRIVLISASRKNEWILPKGGWDSDETKEECAVRETYEEGGLLGRLGLCLAPIDYESGKSKKSRMEKRASGEVALEADKGKTRSEGGEFPPHAKKAKVDSEHQDLTTFASPNKPSFIRLILFPLYLTEVRSEWPEKGRLRKLVDIDEAIRIMEQQNRHYFKKGLEMVKEMRLHSLSHNDGKTG